MENNLIKKRPKRLIIEVPSDLHARIKIRCAKRLMHIRAYVMHAVMRSLLEDEQYD